MKKTFIIAEAGVNHNGSLELAKKMIDQAVSAGADAIKFQTFQADRLVSKHAKKAKYQKKYTTKDEFQHEMLKKLELDESAHKELILYCKSKNITFISTPFDHPSIDLLHRLGLKIFKIPSGEITNLPYLRKIGSLRKKIIMSTGMSYLGEIEDALNTLTQSGTDFKNIIVLHCNTEYPTPFKDVNLKAIITIKDAFPGIRVGYSDHTLGIEVPIAAVSLGAAVIEKHFTLDKCMEGPDHKASLSPKELEFMVKAIRNVEISLGQGKKKASPSERKNIATVRKSIVAKKCITKGDFFSKDNITVKRPGTGISPMLWDDIIGQRAKKDFQEDETISL